MNAKDLTCYLLWFDDPERYVEEINGDVIAKQLRADRYLMIGDSDKAGFGIHLRNPKGEYEGLEVGNKTLEGALSVFMHSRKIVNNHWSGIDVIISKEWDLLEKVRREIEKSAADIPVDIPNKDKGNLHYNEIRWKRVYVKSDLK